MQVQFVECEKMFKNVNITKGVFVLRQYNITIVKAIFFFYQNSLLLKFLCFHGKIFIFFSWNFSSSICRFLEKKTFFSKDFDFNVFNERDTVSFIIYSKNPSSPVDVAWRPKHCPEVLTPVLVKLWHNNDVFDEKKGE